MKKLFAILLAVSMLVSLSACGGESEPSQTGITFENSLDFNFVEVYVVQKDSSGWGDPIMEISEGYDDYFYPENLFGTREPIVDILVIDEGNNQYISYGIPLEDGDVVTYYFDADGVISIDVNEVYKYDVEVIASGSEVNTGDDNIPYGVWEYDEYLAYFAIYDDGTWAKIGTSNWDISISGYYEFADEDTIELYADDDEYSGFYGYMYKTDENGHPLPYEVLRSNDEGMLSYLCSFDSAEYQDILAKVSSSDSYFAEADYVVNYEFGLGEERMHDGGRIFTPDGRYYEAMDVKFAMELDSYTDLGDGYAEIVFTEAVLFDSVEYPDFTILNDYNTGFSGEFYDYYTGYLLPMNEYFANSSRGENYHYFMYESEGRSVRIEIDYVAEIEKYDDNSMIFAVQYTVVMPIDYDGLVYAHLTAEPDFDSYIEAQEYEPSDYYIMDQYGLYGAVFCRVNDLD